MGNARWDNDTYTTYSKTTSYRSASREQVFQSRNMPRDLNPANIPFRESCDSAENPNSTPVIFALDVTGSMGEYAELIAKTSLPELMGKLLELKPITDPHLMFMGVGDVSSDHAPLQVSQFEADIRILEQLRTLWLEGNGGGNGWESYNLPWHFAAYNTKIDCFDKRGQKGYLFTFGDETPPPALSTSQLSRVFGTGDIPTHKSTGALLAKAQEKYQVFHVVIEQGSYCRSSKDRVRNAWSELLGPNALFLRNADNLTELVLCAMKIAEGADLDTTIENSDNPDEMRYAFHNVLNQVEEV